MKKPDGKITDINDGFDELWKGNLNSYDDVEIHGVVNLNDYNEIDTVGTCCEVDDEANPPHFYSVYARLKAGGYECIGDFTKYEDAEAYAEKAGKLIKGGIR